MCIKRANVSVEIVSPNFADELLARDRNIAVREHIEEEIVLLRGHLDALAVNKDKPRRNVCLKSSVIETYYNVFLLRVFGI